MSAVLGLPLKTIAANHREKIRTSPIRGVFIGQGLLIPSTIAANIFAEINPNLETVAVPFHGPVPGNLFSELAYQRMTIELPPIRSHLDVYVLEVANASGHDLTFFGAFWGTYE